MPHIYEFIWQVGIYKSAFEAGLFAIIDILCHFMAKK